ncbi:MAG TPA: helix-turn-helix transcriptional regulator [Chthoniobacterales bacterium]|jgi:transcriptional regulator with XRE-family HTH domain
MGDVLIVIVAAMPHAVASQLDRELSEFLRRTMKTNGWSYADLSKRAGVSKAMLQRIVELERFATLNLLARICAKLEVNLSEVFPKSISRRHKT